MSPRLWRHWCGSPECGRCDDVANEPAPCSECKGTGQLFDSEADGMVVCHWCDGTGEGKPC